MHHLRNLTVLILGLGDSGLAMARWCARCGASVRVADTRANPPQAATLAADVPGATLHQGLDPSLLDGVNLLFKSPGLMPNAPEVAPILARADELGIPVRGELSLFASALADLKTDLGYAPKLVAITGTNGKTTCAYLLAQAADLVGRRGMYLGTIGFGRPGALSDPGLTTPDVVSVHRRLAAARDAGARTMSLEVSSHALDQERVAAVRFDSAVFTNLTRDHRDYHGTLDAYGEAKARLFRMPGLQRAVINVRDEFGARLATTIDPSVERVLFAASNELWIEPGAGWIRLPEMRATPAGLTLHVESSWGAGTLRSKLIGEFNAAIYNLAKANLDESHPTEIVAEADYMRDGVLPAIEAVRAVADRLEKVVADDLWPLPKYSEVLFVR